ncbi:MULTISPECIES: GntR family transcriptional regulator [unclassified Aureimonas]|uniref:GntR family transcriptional regulator n=1 Tax=unclassified Aureimonas TaxID=2615206 RepID=UPI0006F3BF39|nr:MULTISPECIES: GntR family transcriptional regulator [unclassified Aureimonas]KQT64386.1 GntR family transcriptional regulator [Aureimonas sp. Leaf427]KQT81578.1 GntR family transcriptional regulator [Aureimonas sp. Leaf460]
MEPKRDSQTLKAELGVRDIVLGGRMTPGERLSEVALAGMLGVSRTPLRAALSRLEQEGLLELIPSGGYAIRSFTTTDVFDAIELRGVMEGTALRLAAERGVPAARLAQLRSLVGVLDKTFTERLEDMQFERYVELNAEFHALLALLPGSETMRRELARVAQLPFASPSAFLEKQGDVPAFRQSLVFAQRQHHDMVHALEQREGARAECLGREHARLARRNLEFVMGEDRSLIRKVPGLTLIVA